MKLRFNDLTLSREPSACVQDLLLFASVYAAVKVRFGLDCKVYSVRESKTGCTLGEVFRYVAHARDELDRTLTKKDAFVLKNLLAVILIENESCDSTFDSMELGHAVEAAVEASSSCEGALSVGLDYPPGRSLVQELQKRDDPDVSRQAVCVTCDEHLADDVFKRIAFCNAPNVGKNKSDRGYTAVSYDNRHFLDRGVPESTPRQWKTEGWYEETKTARRAKFKPGVQFGDPCCLEYERRVLLDAMRAGKYTEEATDDHEATLDEIVGVSLAQPTSRIHVCLSSRFLHLYPCP